MIDDIRYLIVFAKVAEAGSFSAGAEALGLTTATASAHVSRLERSLGTALFYRNTRRISLTHEGSALLETASGMLSLYQSGIARFRPHGAADTETLRVAIPASLLQGPFMAALADFIRRHPQIMITLRCRDSREDIIGESIDLAFRIGELADSGLKARRVYDLDRQVVAAPALLQGRAAPLHPGELSGLPWIGLTMRPNARTFVGPDGARCEIRYRPIVEVDSVEAAYQLSLQGLGLSAPPLAMARAALASGAVLALLPDWALEPLRVSAIWPANVPADSAVHRLVDAMCQAMRADATGNSTSTAAIG